MKPDPSRIGGVAEAPFARLPEPGTLFAARAERLRVLAADHLLSGYLRLLASVADAQAGCVAGLPPPAPVPEAQLAQRLGNGFPPLSVDQVRGNRDFAAALSWLLHHLDLSGAPAATLEATDRVRAMPEGDRTALAADIMEGGCPLDRLAESLFVAAAVQVHLSRLAATLDPAMIVQPAEGICPVCGGAPVSSVVVGWTQASKARYCACSLCGTLWNAVRIKCTACASTDGIAYYTLEDAAAEADAAGAAAATGANAAVLPDGAEGDAPGDAGGDPAAKAPAATIGVETCNTCRSYIKHMQQHADPKMDPVADDVASYALDLLAREQDFRRAGLNPLFLTA